MLGVHAGLWGFDWSPESARKTISSAKAAGFGLIEIPAVSSDTHDWSITKDLLEEFQIKASVSLALDFESDINTTDLETSIRGESRLIEAVMFAAAIGADFVGGVTFSAMGRYLTLPTMPSRANSLAVLRRVAKKAEPLGITIGIEYVNRYESNLLNTAAATRKFIEDLNAPNVVLHMDTFHALIEEADLNAAVTDSIGQLGYIHASESHRGELGTGALAWPSFIDNLKKNGYRGPITVETFSSAVIKPNQSVDIGLWEAKWLNPDVVAKDSFNFLKSLLEKSSN